MSFLHPCLFWEIIVLMNDRFSISPAIGHWIKPPSSLQPVVWQIIDSGEVPSVAVRWTTPSLIRQWFLDYPYRWWPCPLTLRQTPRYPWPHWCGKCLCDGTCSGSGTPEYIRWWRSPLQWSLQRKQSHVGFYFQSKAMRMWHHFLCIIYCFMYDILEKQDLFCCFMAFLSL